MTAVLGTCTASYSDWGKARSGEWIIETAILSTTRAQISAWATPLAMARIGRRNGVHGLDTGGVIRTLEADGQRMRPSIDADVRSEASSATLMLRLRRHSSGLPTCHAPSNR